MWGDVGDDVFEQKIQMLLDAATISRFGSLLDSIG